MGEAQSRSGEDNDDGDAAGGEASLEGQKYRLAAAFRNHSEPPVVRAGDLVLARTDGFCPVCNVDRACGAIVLETWPAHVMINTTVGAKSASANTFRFPVNCLIGFYGDIDEPRKVYTCTEDSRRLRVASAEEISEMHLLQKRAKEEEIVKAKTESDVAVGSQPNPTNQQQQVTVCVNGEWQSVSFGNAHLPTTDRGEPPAAPCEDHVARLRQLFATYWSSRTPPDPDDSFKLGDIVAWKPGIVSCNRWPARGQLGVVTELLISPIVCQSDVLDIKVACETDKESSCLSEFHFNSHLLVKVSSVAALPLGHGSSPINVSVQPVVQQINSSTTGANNNNNNNP